ncbi:hypothetical protein CASFOL_021570 [Castilleja foliolosa]|uniref:non-specific serine/threonine protein kinase n=1 Tax=Castilleja foliolosa TaxID=1961234 RepID=A0ABD3CYY9_9LAMI
MDRFLCFGSTQSGSPNAAGAQSGPSNATGTQAGDQAGDAIKIPPTISMAKLRKATGNFSYGNQISTEYSVQVFEGKLWTWRKRMTVAVKRLRLGDGRDADYGRELGMLSRLNHRHIINLVGCYDGHRDNVRFLVYEFMPLGNLFDCIRVSRTREGPLSWRTRMKIGAGVAKGLSYLHNRAIPRVIHSDLKSCNVLLDKGCRPKISGFRSALSVPIGQPAIVTTEAVTGTDPYRAPEALTRTITDKSDVFSFGALLLEITSGNVHLDRNYVKFPENFVDVADRRMGEFQMVELVKVVTLIRHCIEENPDSRPEMSVVEQAMRNLAGERNVDWPQEHLDTEEMRLSF